MRPGVEAPPAAIGTLDVVTTTGGEADALREAELRRSLAAARAAQTTSTVRPIALRTNTIKGLGDAKVASFKGQGVTTVEALAIIQVSAAFLNETAQAI